MVMLAEDYDYVIGGDPDRDTVDLAVVDTATGGVRAHLVDQADGPGYARMLAWAQQQAPGRRVWALEGTGSFAAGLAVFLAEAGEDVVEIGGVKRARRAKSDRIDAVQAARTALSREQQATPRGRGLREALRMVLVTRQAVLVSRTKAINELKSLIVVAPEQLRARLRGCPLAKQLDRIEELVTPAGASVEHRVTVLTLRSIAHTARSLHYRLITACEDALTPAQPEISRTSREYAETAARARSLPVSTSVPAPARWGRRNPRRRANGRRTRRPGHPLHRIRRGPTSPLRTGGPSRTSADSTLTPDFPTITGSSSSDTTWPPPGGMGPVTLGSSSASRATRSRSSSMAGRSTGAVPR